MKYCNKWPLAVLTAFILALTACDDDSGGIGPEVIPPEDGIQISQAIYDVSTRSLKADSVLATTGTSYLGKVIDPETGAITTCDFLTQFHIMEDYGLPERDSMNIRNDLVQADSVELRFYISSYYGDSLNTMKLGVYELDTAHVMSENKPYYTNLDPEEWINKKPGAITKELTFSVKDMAQSDSAINASERNWSIRVKLPASYGTFLLNKYYENPADFKNSYNFIHNVCAGFYVRTLGGSGTMVGIDVSTLTVYFRYLVNGVLTQGMQRMAATEEVLQNTHIEHQNIEPLLHSNDYTFIKSPAGIYTELDLPVDEIFSGEHLNDSLNGAKIALPRYNNKEQASYNLKTPSTLLMVRKSERYAFFEKDKSADGKTSFLASFAPAQNSYTFDNCAALISYLKRERDEGAGVTGHESEDVRRAKWRVWEAVHPEWNTVVLLPVVPTYSSTGALMRVRNDMSLGSTRLLGGKNGGIKVSVVYSRFRS